MTQLWHDMMSLDLPILEKILRAVLVYAFLIVALRLAGKRELAQLNPFDLVVLLTLSNTVQNAIIGNDNSVSGGLIGAATLLGINYIVIRFLYSHDKIDRFVEGSPSLLIEDGKVIYSTLKEELITLAELEAAAHKQGFGSLSQIERGVLESGGSISFIGKQPNPDEIRHQELMLQLQDLKNEINNLKNRLVPKDSVELIDKKR
ncbi:MAG: DUF421 domain-containing protein [Deltaproteobacteria bacterium]|nr:DUF421 domain-containing protein [Deltaproteobacteria bacterium]